MLPANRQKIERAFFRESDQPREKYLLKLTFLGGPAQRNFKFSARAYETTNTYKNEALVLVHMNEQRAIHRSPNMESC